jgi:hypothetical protein
VLTGLLVLGAGITAVFLRADRPESEPVPTTPDVVALDEAA